MEEIKTIIIQLGDENNINDLQKYITNINIKELTSFLNEYICDHRHGGKIWNYLLQSFDDSLNSHNKRVQITIFVLKLIDESDVSDTTSNGIIQRLLVELPKFKPNDLIEIWNFCVEKIQAGNILHTSWKDLIPEILSVLVEKNYITYNNVQMSGIQFKNQIIDSLCLINWSTNQVTLLASMFRDIPLTKQQHLQVVTKLSLCMANLTCQELPAFTYQLLKLCSKQNSRLIFLSLQYYFSNRIYKNLGKDVERSSDSTDFDEIINSNEHDAVQVESTVLYYIHESATLGNDCIKEYLNSLKNMTKAPEFILHPFQLTVLLTVSSVSIFEEQAIDIIRSCIVRVITEDAKKNDTAWFRSNISPSHKTTDIISAVLENSIKERPYVLQGFINLSFVLLSTGAALGMKNIAEAQWELGTYTLLKLMKMREEVSNTIMKQLCNRIVAENVPHLTNCLYEMCRNFRLAMLENQNIIIQLTEESMQLPGRSSKFIVDAIMPLIKVSCRVRDHLIICLRKALYAKELEIRKLAVNGYLKLLKELRVSNLAVLSQGNSSNSNYSFLTQVSLENHLPKSVSEFSNESVCLEVLGILRRCFMQQAEVRNELYSGLHDAVFVNSELGISVLNMLTNHFNQFYIYEDDTLPPLDFSKIILKNNNGVILQEPIGHLIYVIGIIHTKVKESHDHSDPIFLRTTTVLDSLCTRMAKCELIHFNLDTGRDLLDDSLESQTDLHKLKQALSVYEALMGYLINSWNRDSENTAQKLSSLFQAYCRFIDLTKNFNKAKKSSDGTKKTKDETKNKTIPQVKKREFKTVSTVLDFQTAGKILSLLYETNVSWADNSQSNILKVKFEYHRYVLNVILQLLQNIKTSKCLETIQTKAYFNYFTELSAILYERILQRLSYVLDFDITTAVFGVECFYTILNLVAVYYEDRLKYFLLLVHSKTGDKDQGHILFEFIKNIQTYFDENDDDYNNDSEGKKLPVLMANIYTILVTHLPYYKKYADEVLDWLKKFTNENIASNKQVGNMILSIYLNLNIRCKEESGLYENIAIKLCDTIGTINNDKPECPVQLKIINESTALTALSSLAHTLKLMLNEADWMIQRCKAEYSMIIHPGADKIERREELLKGKEKNICCHICRIVNICTLLSNMAVPPGGNAEIVFKLLTHLHNTLNSLTKYFLQISSRINPAFQRAKFEQVLKLSGKPLSNTVYSFILYIEQGPEPEEDATQQKKKSSNPNTMKTKILRQTRLIPKLVYEMEQFGRNVITLSNKTKIDLSKYVGLGTFRDFRIKAPALKEALDELREDLDETSEDTSMEIDEQPENSSPPEKKSRKS